MMKETCSILFLTKYSRMGASTRYRFLQYFPTFAEQGIICHHAPLFDDDYLICKYSKGAVSVAGIIKRFIRRLFNLCQSKQYDLLVIEGELLPYFSALFERFLSLLNIPYVVDYDDAIFHRYDQHRNLIVRFLLGKKIAQVMKHAKLVIAGNEYLADYAMRAGARSVKIVPTVVDIEQYPTRSGRKRNPFTVGWIGSPTTTRHLELIAPALRQICTDQKGKLALIGAGPIDLPGITVSRRAWTEATEIENLQSFDVGVMPLVDEPFERGKCGFKLIQYMACGLPVIASPVGVNVKIVDHGINGFLCSTAQEWAEALAQLRDDPCLRAQMGHAGRQKVEAHYSLQSIAGHFIQLLKNVNVGMEKHLVQLS